MSYRTQLVSALRRRYPKGTRVELVEMLDSQAPPVGTKGTVNHVDDMGTIHITWDNGSSLGVVPDIDVIKKYERRCKQCEEQHKRSISSAVSSSR